jgi:hypothetical protein
MHPGYTSPSGYNAAPKLIYLVDGAMPRGNWADCTPANIGGRPLQVAYGAGRFAVLSYVYATSTGVTVATDGYYVITSPDLTNWTAGDRALPNADNIVFDGTRFWVSDYTGNKMYSSYNGQDWIGYNYNLYSSDRLGSDMAYGNGQLAITETHLPAGIRNDYFNDDQAAAGLASQPFSVFDIAAADYGYNRPSLRNDNGEIASFAFNKIFKNKDSKDTVVNIDRSVRQPGKNFFETNTTADNFISILDAKRTINEAPGFAEYFKRTVTFIRGVRDGFNETLTASDFFDSLIAVGREVKEIMIPGEVFRYFYAAKRPTNDSVTLLSDDDLNLISFQKNVTYLFANPLLFFHAPLP